MSAYGNERMIMSEINKALVKAQSEFPPIDLNAEVEVRKDGRLIYTFNYATLGHIKELTDPALHKNGLAVIHVRDGNTLISQLIHTSGEFKESKSILRISERATQQEEGSVVSYQKRYAHTGLLGIVAEKDDDANIADGSEAKSRTPAKPTVPQKPVAPAQKVAENATIPQDKPKMTKGDITWRNMMQDCKKGLGEEAYRAILKQHGYAKSTDITEKPARKLVYDYMTTQIEANKEQANEPEREW
jgi:hypothetical protein